MWLPYCTSYRTRTCWVEVLLKEESDYVTKLTTGYGAGTCSLHVLSLLTEELPNMLHWQQFTGQEYAHWTFLHCCMKNHKVRYIDSSVRSENKLLYYFSIIIDVLPPLTEGPQNAIYWQQLTEREHTLQLTADALSSTGSTNANQPANTLRM
jgi:hypothetical protein